MHQNEAKKDDLKNSLSSSKICGRNRSGVFYRIYSPTGRDRYKIRDADNHCKHHTIITLCLCRDENDGGAIVHIEYIYRNIYKF